MTVGWELELEAKHTPFLEIAAAIAANLGSRVIPSIIDGWRKVNR